MEPSRRGNYSPSEGRAERGRRRRLDLSTPAQQPQRRVREPNRRPRREPEPDPPGQRPRRDLQPPAGVLNSLPSIAVTKVSECTVCMEEFRVGGKARQLPCRHLFHEICIRPWFASHATCPTCRYEVPAVAAALQQQGVNGNSSAEIQRQPDDILVSGQAAPEEGLRVDPFPRPPTLQEFIQVQGESPLLEGAILADYLRRCQRERERESRPRRARPVVTGESSSRPRSPSPRSIPPSPPNSPHPQTPAASVNNDNNVNYNSA